MDLVTAGISQDVVIAKIRKTISNFDTSPAALKVLKAANVSDAVLLAMIEASYGSPNPIHADTSEVAIPARINCTHSDPVPVFSAPHDKADSVEAFAMKCGDRATIIEPIKNASWVKIRNPDGKVGYISWAILSMQASDEPTKQNVTSDTVNQSANKRHQRTQKASDDLEDCKVRAENDYQARLGVINTLNITPIQRVAVANKLKQNLDAENRNCRTQYESRLRDIDAH